MKRYSVPAKTHGHLAPEAPNGENVLWVQYQTREAQVFTAEETVEKSNVYIFTRRGFQLQVAKHRVEVVQDQTQMDLFQHKSISDSAPLFDGATFDPEQDQIRLSGQLAQVFHLLSNGAWWTIPELAEAVGCSETSASARLRDLRKEKFGGHHVERDRVAGGLYRYRLKGTANR